MLNHTVTDAEIQALATLTDISPESVRFYFFDHAYMQETFNWVNNVLMALLNDETYKKYLQEVVESRAFYQTQIETRNTSTRTMLRTTAQLYFLKEREFFELQSQQLLASSVEQNDKLKDAGYRQHIDIGRKYLVQVAKDAAKLNDVL